MQKWFRVISAVAIALIQCSCGWRSRESAQGSAADTRYFQVKGVVEELSPDLKTATIKHEEVPNYMPPMTMPFEVRNTNELRGLTNGDAVSFRMVVKEKEGWIDHVKKLNTSPAQLPSKPAYRVVRDVELLKEGELLTEYHFTNELGRVISTSQFKGQALAFTFFFTRCPFPTFCPLVSNNFDEAAHKLAARTSGPTNWHLLSISFDPEHDTPAGLKAYADRYKYDPSHWSFVTGDLTDITAIGDQFDERFWREGDSISHNLRTVVIDAQGRVQKLIRSNTWTSDELVEEIIKAAAAKP